jgi:hypothetical protein
VLEYALTLTRDLAYIWPRCPHQYYLGATPPLNLAQHGDLGRAFYALRIFYKAVDVGYTGLNHVCG